jgi:hypothetical protein
MIDASFNGLFRYKRDIQKKSDPLTNNIHHVVYFSQISSSRAFHHISLSNNKLIDLITLAFS